MSFSRAVSTVALFADDDWGKRGDAARLTVERFGRVGIGSMIMVGMEPHRPAFSSIRSFREQHRPAQQFVSRPITAWASPMIIKLRPQLVAMCAIKAKVILPARNSPAQIAIQCFLSVGILDFGAVARQAAAVQ